MNHQMSDLRYFEYFTHNLAPNLELQVSFTTWHPTFQVTSDFIHNIFCPLAMSSICHFVNMPCYQFLILSTCHVINLTFSQLVTLLPSHGISLSLCQLAMSSTGYFIKLTIFVCNLLSIKFFRSQLRQTHNQARFVEPIITFRLTSSESII